MPKTTRLVDALWDMEPEGKPLKFSPDRAKSLHVTATRMKKDRRQYVVRRVGEEVWVWRAL